MQYNAIQQALLRVGRQQTITTQALVSSFKSGIRICCINNEQSMHTINLKSTVKFKNSPMKINLPS
jgi:hypothetical protein